MSYNGAVCKSEISLRAPPLRAKADKAGDAGRNQEGTARVLSCTGPASVRGRCETMAMGFADAAFDKRTVVLI